MREIEIKVQLTDKAVTVEQLTKLGVELSKPVKQRDVVYGMPGAEEGSPSANWLRIRTENDTKHIFTLKRSVVGHLDSIEHETVIDDPKELAAIITELGFELYSDLTKIRAKGKLGDVELCLDEVPSLGVFLEAEKIMQNDADHDQVVAELWGLFAKLGIEKSQEIHEGYDVLERKKRGVGK